MPIRERHRCPSSYWTSYCTHRQTGYQSNGTSSTRIFSGRPSAINTQNNNAAMGQFHKFCTQFNVHSPFLVTEYLLCCYAPFLANRSLTPQTINSYLSAVRNMQITLGLPDPREKSFLLMLKRVQAGLNVSG